MAKLQGKVALITGGGSGIGKAIAERFAAAGAAVCVADRDGDAAEAVASTLTAWAMPAHFVTVDVRDAPAVQQLVQDTVRVLGGLDILVTSAGIGGKAPLTEMSLELWEEVLAVNLTGTFLCTQAAARYMIPKGRGRIVHLASAWGQRGVTHRTAYGASKGGVIAFMKAAAVELAPQGITVNALCPGPIETPLVKQHHDAATRARVCDGTPMGRYGSPQEVAAAALWLASDDAAYITGHALNVDGGWGATGFILPTDAD